MKILSAVMKAMVIILYFIIVILVITIIAVLAFGIKLYGVQTGSMEPTCTIGTLVVVQPVAFEDIHEQDIITFTVAENTIVTHRVIGIDREKQLLETKGDNNTVADSSPVSYGNVVGKVRFQIPYAGYIIVLSNTRFGRIMLGIIMFGLVGAYILKKIYYHIPEDEAEDESEDENTDGEDKTSENETYDNENEPDGDAHNEQKKGEFEAVKGVVSYQKKD